MYGRTQISKRINKKGRHKIQKKGGDAQKTDPNKSLRKKNYYCLNRCMRVNTDLLTYEHASNNTNTPSLSPGCLMFHKYTAHVKFMLTGLVWDAVH